MHSDLHIKISPFSWTLLLSLYVTQFLAMGFFLVALVAIMRDLGFSLEMLSTIYLLGLFWVLKPLWAPVIDKYRLPGRGHFRSWLMLLQGSMVLVLLLLSQLMPENSFWTVFMVCMVFAFLSATQDIATDGLALRLLTPANRGIGNGVQSAGGLIGNMLGGGGVLLLYPFLGWQGSILLLSAVTSISLILLFFLREPEVSFATQEKVGFVRRALKFWRQPGYMSWLKLLLIMPMGIGLGYGLLVPMLVDSGWSMDQIGLVMNVAGSLCGIGASILTGMYIRKVGRYLALRRAAWIQCFALLCLLIPAAEYTSQLSVYFAVCAYFIAFSAVSTVLMTLMMDHASVETPATDYALQFSINIMMSYIMSSFSMLLAGWLSYWTVILLAFALSVLGYLLVNGLKASQCALLNDSITLFKKPDFLQCGQR